VVPAGVISHTGVGGLTLGGGMGWVSRKYGLTIDSLLGAEMVTAQGEILWVDARSDSELFWGIRGGGGNFGIVTRFRFRMHDFGPVVVGRWTYGLAAATQALRRLRDLARAASRELTVNFTVSGSELSLTAVWFGEDAMAEQVLSPFGTLAGTGTGGIGRLSYLDLQSRNDALFAWLRRYYVKGGFWRDIDDDAITHMLRQAASAPTPDCEINAMQLGGAVTDIADDAAAYSGRDAGYYWLVEPVWDDPADDRRCLAWGRETARGLKDPSMEGNYVNEQGDAGSEVAIDAYGAAKYQRLANLKRRMDPANLFRLNQNIKPAS
jgi:FAD/FMN-containing dehydrogenase